MAIELSKCDFFFFIGTFGEKQHWRISDTVSLPRKVPPGLHQVASFNTIQTVAGPSQSKWMLVTKKKHFAHCITRLLHFRLAKQLFQQLMKSKQFKNVNEAFGGTQGDYIYDESYTDDILGESYKRKAPYRQPVKPMTLRSSEQRLSVYSSLTCSEIQEPDLTLPHLNTFDLNSERNSESSVNSTEVSSINPKNPFTEKMLLPKFC